MRLKSIPICVLMVLMMPFPGLADDLTKIIQKDLIALGYDPGNIQGEMSTETIVAISKFQAENNLEVTGEASPQLAGVIKAKLKEKDNPGGGAASAPAVAAAAPANDAAALQAAQQACLQEKIAAAQASQKKKKGFGSLVRAVTNTASRYGGGSDLARQVSETSYDIYNANATAGDWERAAEDLGLSQDDLEACRNPQ
ncbi:MAG: peptidoglycan-binding protein [Gammaproteobacteria bacterium]|nr:peptidoglycan-binding protein [Gammaproteobacteria bacterium]